MAHHLRKFREELGISRSALAAAAFMSVGRLARIENGSVWPSDDEVRLLVSALLAVSDARDATMPESFRRLMLRMEGRRLPREAVLSAVERLFDGEVSR